MTKFQLDTYIIDVLMRDIVGHDRMPSAFVVYIWLWTQTKARGRSALGVSLAAIAAETGLSKSSVQNAARALTSRGLVRIQRKGITEAPVYEVLEPWKR